MNISFRLKRSMLVPRTRGQLVVLLILCAELSYLFTESPRYYVLKYITPRFHNTITLLTNKKYEKVFKISEPLKLRPKVIANHKASNLRADKKCGLRFLAPNGKPAECDMHGSRPCCSASGECGNSKLHCECKDCKKYRMNKLTVIGKNGELINVMCRKPKPPLKGIICDPVKRAVATTPRGKRLHELMRRMGRSE